MFVQLHHIESGPADLLPIDAGHALSFPQEWSKTPWSDEAKADWAEKMKAKREAEEAEKVAKMREEFILREKARLLSEAEIEVMREQVKAQLAAEMAASKKK